MEIKNVTYSELLIIEKELKNRLLSIDRGAFSYLGRDLDALEKYERSVDEERSQIQTRLKKLNEYKIQLKEAYWDIGGGK